MKNKMKIHHELGFIPFMFGSIIYALGNGIILILSMTLCSGCVAQMVNFGFSSNYFGLALLFCVLAVIAIISLFIIPSDNFLNRLISYATELTPETTKQLNNTDNDATYGGMVIPKTWDEFRSSGLLWFINTILHPFGYAIVLDIDQDTVKQAYPARVRYRGFDGDVNSEGYIKLSKYMKDHIDELVEEANE